MTKGKTFIISGPSGVGKSTVLNALLKEYPDLYFSVSATTRGPREGEVDGVHYHFIAPEFFHQMIEEDAFLEYAEYVGNFYGTPKKFVDAAMDEGRDVILDIEIQGAQQVCAKRPDLYSAAFLGGTGASSDISRNGRYGQGAKASAAGQGGTEDGGSIRLFCGQ